MMLKKEELKKGLKPSSHNIFGNQDAEKRLMFLIVKQ